MSRELVIRRLVEGSRRVQGLPPSVSDAATLLRLARLLVGLQTNAPPQHAAAPADHRGRMTADQKSPSNSPTANAQPCSGGDSLSANPSNGETAVCENCAARPLTACQLRR